MNTGRLGIFTPPSIWRRYVALILHNSESCPTCRESYPAQAFLVCTNTGETYSLDVYLYHTDESPDDEYGGMRLSFGYDEISEASIHVTTYPGERDGYAEIYRGRRIVSAHKMKSVFCGDCIREILNTIDGQLLEEVVLFDAEQKAFYPVRDEETLQIILLGKGLGNQKWNVSAPHGAGRILKQECVKERYTVSQFSRDKSTKKRYGRAWKRIRDKYASEHPFCELCFERGLAVPVEEIHHKKPLSEGGAHDRSNLIALCKSCHSQIHAKCGDRWG